MISLKSLAFERSSFTPVCLVIVLATLAYLFDKQLSTSLIYDRNALALGQYWRIVTGHFFHTNLAHFLLNSAAVVLLWALHGSFYRYSSYLVVFIISAVTCSLGMYYFSTSISLYVGLSGVLHGFFVWGALHDIRTKEFTGYLLLIGVMIKIAHEQLYGASSDVEKFINAPVAVDAHLYGAIGGVIAFLILAVLKQRVK